MPFEPMILAQGFVSPAHAGTKELELVQPPKLDPEPALATSVIEAPFTEEVMFGEHVELTVCDACSFPVPPQLAGAFTVPVLGVIVTDPDPVPANVSTQLRAEAT
jgi:hypothetical protein